MCYRLEWPWIRFEVFISLLLVIWCWLWQTLTSGPTGSWNGSNCCSQHILALLLPSQLPKPGWMWTLSMTSATLFFITFFLNTLCIIYCLVKTMIYYVCYCTFGEFSSWWYFELAQKTFWLFDGSLVCFLNLPLSSVKNFQSAFSQRIPDLNELNIFKWIKVLKSYFCCCYKY